MPIYSYEEFLKKYSQAEDRNDVPGRRTLGHGGASTGVERWTYTATGEQFAVKGLSPEYHSPDLLENEVHGLIRANKCKTPRVVKFEELIVLPKGDGLVVLELVDGTSLSKLLAGLNQFNTGHASLCKLEQQVIEIAAQLMQTVHLLHMGSNLAHLDITSSNIMLRKAGYSAWDQLRLLDFAFAQCCSEDVTVLDVNPQGATPAYAAPELLRSLQLQCQGAGPADPGLLINGPSADWWAVGIVLFELLRQRAARFLCCGSPSPTLEAMSHVSHDCSPAKAEIKSSKWWKVLQPSKRRRQRSSDVAACTDASVHSQNGAVQADSCQEPAHTAFQGIRFGESRQVTEELPQAMANPVQIATGGGFDTTSLALPKQAEHVRAVSVTASASSAHEPQVQSLQQQHGVAGHSGYKHDKNELVKQHCSAGMEEEQVVGGAPLPEELQEHVVDAVSDRGTSGSGKKGWKSKGTRMLKRLLRR